MNWELITKCGLLAVVLVCWTCSLIFGGGAELNAVLGTAASMLLADMGIRKAVTGAVTPPPSDGGR